jgi:L-2-hydroxyglutarate oxidase LhgO
VLLQKSKIPEGKGYGGFPVSGIWLRCDVDAISNRHHAKVYGKAAVGSPPMSVPHLDERIIGGKRSLLFGPYAGFSTRFLKHRVVARGPLARICGPTLRVAPNAVFQHFVPHEAATCARGGGMRSHEI